MVFYMEDYFVERCDKYVIDIHGDILCLLKEDNDI